MLQSYSSSIHTLLHPSILLHSRSKPILSPPLHHRSRPTTPLLSLSTHLLRPPPCLAQTEDSTTTITVQVPEEEDGPIELPETNTLFATTDDPSPLQVATSVLLTGAITVFLFRSVRRRVKRSRELKFRSSGVKKSIKEEAIESLKAVSAAPIGSKGPPSALQTFLGAITAGVIALILYKFTITIEAALNRQTLSDTLSVRQISVTIRTIVNGICYLATFVFGINSVGLFLLSGQLALNSLMGDSTDEDMQNKDREQSLSSNSAADVSDSDSTRDGDQSSEGKQQ
ncbi:uncharacterized protein [Rutidosis leptorrhynchoides]|uniref:uncharacterized protein n=1 Tax=Rutidosis leptorrhynchoides TaxID=125765 RepID=UPI003A99F746